VIFLLGCLMSWLRNNGESGDREADFPSVGLMFTELLISLSMEFLNSCRSGTTL
jgi:hypothetical protein